MEIHQLRYAVEVHRRGSFTSAAEALHVSQSGVSAQVAKLERELGVRLFERGPRTAMATADGTALLPLMAQTLDDLTRIEQATDDLLGLTRGSLRVGTVIGCTIPGYLDAFTELRTAHPGITVSASEGNSAGLITQLAAGDIDVALLAHAEPLPTQFDVTTFVDEPIAVGVPAAHPWARRSTITVADLSEVDVLTLVDGTGIRSALQQTCSRVGATVTPAVEAHSPETVQALAARGVGVAVLSVSMITAPLSAVSIDGAAHARLSFASRKQPGRAVRTFTQLLRSHLLSEAGGPSRGS